MFRGFADWLSTTPLSAALQDAAWVIPVSQSIHIMAVSVLFASACMINLRILGLTRYGRTVSQLAHTLLPWMWSALLVLLATGTVQTIAEPVRQFVTPVFWAKMSMVLVTTGMTALFARRVRADAAAWDHAASRPRGARGFAILTTVLWVAIIVCGRFIGYTFAFYE
jgi:hypothetical protein